ncbi:hypothetical protein DID88_009034 [Monilinia fructigena]|uniref:HTH CENPB-type domain-containing protein n=1 Tax=Monilinia fructigena TaxID=38457 RepID=A0A395IF73_9HELO|nr:hypothetical protein DID88_009034 [Monilinia fructigena]
MQKFPVAKYLAFNIFMWGALLMCQAAARNFTELAVLRALSGAAEGCSDSSFMIITSMWYTRREQPIRIGLWYSANGIGIALGGLIGYGIGNIRGSLASWKYEFLIVGACCCIWGVVLWFFLPDSPVIAKVLSIDEKRMAVERLRGNQTGVENKTFKWVQVKEWAMDYKTCMFFLIGMVSNVPNGGISNFGTLIIKGFGYSTLVTTLMQIPYGAIIAISILACVFLNDRLPPNNRSLMIVLFMLPNIAGAFGLQFLPPNHQVPRLIMYYLTGPYNASFVLLLSVLTANTAGHTKKLLTNATLFIPKSTLTNRMAGRQSRSQSHESFQKLSNAEEKTLVRWISRLTATGYPATPGLLKEMAQEILNQRVIFASSSTPPSFQSNHIGQRWIYRFLDRYPKLKGTYSRKLESARHKEATFETISAWYSTFQARIEERHYELKNIYNMDEIGYAVGETESTRIIVDSTLKSNWKVTAGKQEWITVLECVNADGGSLPPMIIFKAQNTNTAWIPTNTPPNWYFSTSNSGWTSNSHGFEWISDGKEQALNPFSPRQVLNNLPTPLLPPPSTPNTPANPEDLDLSLLNSSPPNDIELRQANKVFNSALSANNLPTSPVQRYAKRITHQIESLNAENAILRKELQEYKELLETRKKRKNGKRIKLKGEFVFSTEEVLKIIEEAEQTPLPKRRRGRPSKRQIDQVEEEMEEEEDSDSSVGSVIVVDHPSSHVITIETQAPIINTSTYNHAV